MGPDTSLAEEIAQETWLAVIHCRDRYSPKTQFRTFLYAIARRRSLDRWRTAQRRPIHAQLDGASDQLAAPAQAEPMQQVVAQSRSEALSRAIDALPLEQREAFLLRAEGDLSIEQIAGITGTCRETAKSRLRYAYATLRRQMESWQ
jgi:RNA polymerase sigma-70 factor (ECF subfamily)